MGQTCPSFLKAVAPGGGLGDKVHKSLNLPATCRRLASTSVNWPCTSLILLLMTQGPEGDWSEDWTGHVLRVSCELPALTRRGLHSHQIL